MEFEDKLKNIKELKPYGLAMASSVVVGVYGV